MNPRRLLGLSSILVLAAAVVGARPPHVAAATKRTSAPAELDELDARAPLPLLPMMANHQKEQMRDHLAAVQEIVAALASDDMPAVARAAGRIGSSEPMLGTCHRMGAGAPGFEEQALAFHRAADRIADAARQEQPKLVLAELDTTLRACTACHAAWKQQVVDEREWRRLTSSEAPGAGSR